MSLVNIEDISVGDIFRIRDFDDMLSEYGSPHGQPDVVNCRFHFVPSMMYLCGKEVTVVGVHQSTQMITLANNDSTREVIRGYSFSADMLEPLDTQEYDGVDIAELEAVLTI